ncbi:hypothetical protein A0257_18545 [Hymenobacter psoromatis]|nr:hypothetical protein A0257_18545 [Hymenobacter psoromatis]
MATIVLAGWRVGLQKIALTKLQQELLQLPLKEAKENVDLLLEGEKNLLRAGRPITLNVADGVVGEFINRANSLGALVGFMITDISSQPTNNSAVVIQQAA